jgi:hypothetical protein
MVQETFILVVPGSFDNDAEETHNNGNVLLMRVMSGWETRSLAYPRRYEVDNRRSLTGRIGRKYTIIATNQTSGTNPNGLKSMLFGP